MDGLQRSTVSFRRQGSSGLVWDDKLVTRQLNKLNERDAAGQTEEVNQLAAADNLLKPINLGRSRSSNDRGGYRTGRVAPTVDPPSPRMSACGFCGGFKKPAAGGGNNKVHKTTKQGKRAKR